jgi:hypothetical protein
MRKIISIALTAAALTSVVGLSACGTANVAKPPVTSNAVPNNQPTVPAEAQPTEATLPDDDSGDYSDDSTDEPAVVNYTPKKSDVSVTLKKKGKHCFGSAGCNVTVEPRVKIDSGLPDEGTLTVYYKIKGDEDGAIENTTDIDLASGDYSMDEEVISTPHSSTKISIAVTEVEFSADSDY